MTDTIHKAAERVADEIFRHGLALTREGVTTAITEAYAPLVDVVVEVLEWNQDPRFLGRTNLEDALAAVVGEEEEGE